MNQPKILLLDCQIDDHALIVAAAASVGMRPEDFCKLAIHLAVRENLIASGARKNFPTL